MGRVAAEAARASEEGASRVGGDAGVQIDRALGVAIAECEWRVVFNHWPARSAWGGRRRSNGTGEWVGARRLE